MVTAVSLSNVIEEALRCLIHCVGCVFVLKMNAHSYLIGQLSRGTAGSISFTLELISISLSIVRVEEIAFLK